MTDFVAPQLGTLENWSIAIDGNGLLTVSGTLNGNAYTTNRLTLLVLSVTVPGPSGYDSGGQVTDNLGTYQLGTPA